MGPSATHGRNPVVPPLALKLRVFAAQFRQFDSLIVFRFQSRYILLRSHPTSVIFQPTADYPASWRSESMRVPAEAHSSSIIPKTCTAQRISAKSAVAGSPLRSRKASPGYRARQRRYNA